MLIMSRIYGDLAFLLSFLSSNEKCQKNLVQTQFPTMLRKGLIARDLFTNLAFPVFFTDKLWIL
jgi:hypothetical protein